MYLKDGITKSTENLPIVQGGAKVVGQCVQLIVQLLLIGDQIFWAQNIPKP